MSEAVYVVQMQQEEGAGPDDRHMAWVDIATVTVPARTHRKTVIEKALDDAGLDLTGGVTVRVLDAGSARGSKVETEQPPPQLKIVG